MDSGTIGNGALWAAVVAAGVALGSWVVGLVAPGRAHPTGAVAAAAGRAAVGLGGAAVAALAWSLVTGNFALAYVADTTTRQGGWWYRLAGLWGGNGGSLLLWAVIILVVGAWATVGRPGARVLAIVTGGAVLAVTAVAANPFDRLAVPAIDGGGLTPILRYPAMLYHPPLLYAGHAGLVAPFALALAALAGGRQEWLGRARQWMLGAWLLLGVGLVAGSHWSYAELGWGGLWAWDPVENGGLLPWLAATAFLHQARRRTGPTEPAAGLAGLAALPFCLSLLGATVSRSGAAQSIHAFAEAAAVGRGLLGVLAAAVAATVFLVVRTGRTTAAPMVLRSREAALAGATGLLLALAAAVTVATVWPALARVVTGDQIAVTSRYYALVATPLVVAAVVLMGVGPSLPGEVARRTPDRVGADVRGAMVAVAAPWLLAGATGVVVILGLAGAGPAVPVALMTAAAFSAVVTAAQLLAARTLRRAGALLAHAGIAVLLLGVGASLLGRHSTQVVRPGSAVRVGGFELRYHEAVTDETGQWQRVRLVIAVSRGGRAVAVLRPGLRVFPGQPAALSDVARHSTVARDLVVAVRQIDPGSQAADLEITVRPLVKLVWWGGLLAAAGGTVVSIHALRRRAPAAAPGPLPVE